MTKKKEKFATTSDIIMLIGAILVFAGFFVALFSETFSEIWWWAVIGQITGLLMAVLGLVYNSLSHFAWKRKRKGK